MGGDTEPHKPVHGTTTDSRSGGETTRDRAVLAAPCHRHGLDERGLPTDTQGWCCGHRRRHGGSLRGATGGQPSGPPRSHQVGPLPGAAGSPGIHPQGRRIAAAARHPNLRRQGCTARYSDGAGSDLRAGLPALLLWLPAGSLGPSSAARPAQCHLEPATVLGLGRRHTEVLRHHGPLPPARFPRQTSHGWCDPADDRQVAEGRGHRRWPAASYDRRLPAGGRDLTEPFERLPAPRAGRVVRERGAAAPKREMYPGPVRR